MQRPPRIGRKESLIDRQRCRLAQFPKREHNNGFPIIGIGRLPSEGVRQPRARIHVTELSREKEAVAGRRLHCDPIVTADTQVELDARSGKTLRAPPSSQQVRFGVQLEHERRRCGKDTLHMQCQLRRHALPRGVNLKRVHARGRHFRWKHIARATITPRVANGGAERLLRGWVRRASPAAPSHLERLSSSGCYNDETPPKRGNVAGFDLLDG